MNAAGAIPILGQDSPQPAAEAVQDEAPLLPVRTAFVIYQTHDGEWVGTNDPVFLDRLALDKAAHPDEIVGGCTSVIQDVQATRTAMQVVQHQISLAQQARAAQANEQVMARLRAEGKLG